MIAVRERLKTSLLVCCFLFSVSVTAVQADPGSLLWADTYGDVTGADGNENPNGIGLDSAGNTYVAGNEWVGNGTGSNGRDAHAVKWESTGSQVTTGWPVIYDSAISDSKDQFLSAAVDGGDNLVSGGVEQNPGWPVCNVMTVAKHTSAGVQQWKKSYGSGSAPAGDPNPSWWDCWHITWSVAVDGSNNVYAVGQNFTGHSTSRYYDWIILKFNAAGSVAQGFPIRYNHTSPTTFELYDIPRGIAVDTGGDFTVVGMGGVNANGTTDRADDDNDWHVRKYEHVDTNMDMVPDTVNLLWSDTYSGPASRNDAAYHAAVDSDGDIFVSGHLNKGADNGTNTNYDWLIIKYAKDGNGSGGATRLWTKTYESATGRSENTGLAALVVDQHDNIYVGGYQRDAANKTHWRLEYRDGDTGNLLHEWVWDDFEGAISGLALRDGRLAIAGTKLVVAGNNDWYTEVYETVPCNLSADADTSDVMLRDTAAGWLGQCYMGSIAGEPAGTGGIYNDVDPGAFNLGWIEQLHGDGFTEGCNAGNDRYCPKDPVTKVQAAKMILKSAGFATPPVPMLPPYTDIPTSHPDANWVAKAKQEGITTGCGDGANFCPDEALTNKGFQKMLDGAF